MNAKQPFSLFFSLLVIAALTYGCCSKRAVRHDGDVAAAPLPVPMKELPPALPAPASEDEKLAWFKEAKYGLFIHWGLYSIPAGEWEGRRVPGIGEWIMHNAPIPVTTYEKFAKEFNPIGFNAEQWVTM